MVIKNGTTVEDRGRFLVLLFGVMMMKKIITLILSFIFAALVLAACESPFIYYKKPINQIGSKWLSSDKNVELVIRDDYDQDSFCTVTLDNGEKMRFYLTFDTGCGMELSDESVITTGVIHEYDIYEDWECSFKSKKKFVATVKETTFFETGQEITFYRVDSNNNESN